MIKMHWKQIAKINKAIDMGLYTFAAEDLSTIIKKKEVIPKKTGALEASQTVIPEGNHSIRLLYTEPYAKKLYENEEGLTIHKAGEPDDRYAKNRNKFARDHWLEEIIFDPKNASKLATCIRVYLNGVFPEKEKADKQVQVEAPKPVEKPVEKPAAKPSWQEQMAKARAEAFEDGIPGLVRAKPSGGPARPSGGPMVRPAGPRPKPKN